MNIFEALRESHEVQRKLIQEVCRTHGDTAERRDTYRQLKDELAAHAMAEERHLYAVIMQEDIGVDPARHAIAEHHEIDELVEALDDTEFDSPGWLPQARALGEKVEHHLEEEEQKFFQLAGKVLTERQKTDLAGAYIKDYREARAG